MGRWFGTDGVRGIANTELTPELAYRLGRAAAAVLVREGVAGPILVGRDTRLSGDMLEASLTAGIASVGVDTDLIGVISTPGVAYLVRHLGGRAGAMISASHNPAEYNGIKFFSHEGYKLPDAVEDEVEQHLDGPDWLPRPDGAGLGRIRQRPEAADAYVEYLAGLLPESLQDWPVVLDCAHGAATPIAPAVFERLGARALVMHHEPDGLNINEQSGALHPEGLAERVKATGARVGFAFDGDADRLIAVDEKGRVVDGDQVMTLTGLHLLRKAKLPHKTLVATVMSNLGLVKAFEAEGGRVIRTKVGDRYVLEAMLDGGYRLGGEQSGHVIFLDRNTSGDGLVTALEIIRVMQETGRPLSELADQMERFPQVLINVQIGKKNGLMENPRIQAAIAEAENALAGNGRVLVRPSGTEPLVRVMVEGRDERRLRTMAEGIAEVIRQELA